MMKKLLALVLVLGIASLATAGIDLNTRADLSYEISGNTVTISTSKDIVGLYFNLQPDAGPVGNFVFAPGFSITSAGSDNGSGIQESISASKGANAAFSGMVLSFDFDAAATTIDFVYSYYANSDVTFTTGTEVLTGYSIVVPEPATMAILGLGGLFLARRKKA